MESNNLSFEKALSQAQELGFAERTLQMISRVLMLVINL
ncbi:MAG: hypothetical protein CM1200mP28_05120 [Deltaproteobacteria bacterium]|nr:MAG: hypothetical protein CM1200mP28_05120 [Deltaproteobacteria bacterium]